jgi:hypothetical protein
MPDAVNDDLGVFGLIEDHIGIRMRNGAAVSNSVRSSPTMGMLGENFNDRMYAMLDVLGAGWRLPLDVIEDGG